MSQTEFESVREGRHYIRNVLSLILTFVYFLEGENEEAPKVEALSAQGEKVANLLQGESGRSKGDQVLAIQEAAGVLAEASTEHVGQVSQALLTLSESADALAKFAASRDFETHQQEKAVDREKMLEDNPLLALLAASLEKASAKDSESGGVVPADEFDDSEGLEADDLSLKFETAEDEDPDKW